jgi:hypothetical protein
MCPYLYEVKLLVNDYDQLVDNFQMLVQQEFIPIRIEKEQQVEILLGLCCTIGCLYSL